MYKREDIHATPLQDVLRKNISYEEHAPDVLHPFSGQAEKHPRALTIIST
jgi:hypothetical protein